MHISPSLNMHTNNSRSKCYRHIVGRVTKQAGMILVQKYNSKQRSNLSACGNYWQFSLVYWKPPITTALIKMVSLPCWFPQNSSFTTGSIKHTASLVEYVFWYSLRNMPHATIISFLAYYIYKKTYLFISLYLYWTGLYINLHTREYFFTFLQVYFTKLVKIIQM